VREKDEASGWALEAIGGEAGEAWCYNCAKVSIALSKKLVSPLPGDAGD
jgi:hypothetical protein